MPGDVIFGFGRIELRRSVFVCAVVCVVTLGAPGYTSLDLAPSVAPLRTTPPGPTQEAAVADAPPGTVLGLADPSVIGMSPSDLDTRFGLISASHAAGLRVDLFWRTIESQPGVLKWSKFDPIVRAAAGHGTPVLAILDYAPPWAGRPGCTDTGPRCAPTDPAAFAAFAQTVVSRYAPLGVHQYEIWNEPNMAARWWPRPSAAEYSSVVRAVCPVIKQADPRAVVVVGALGLGPGANDIAMATFGQQFFAASPGTCWDAFSVHLYNQTTAWDQAMQVRQQMVANGAGAKRMWVTEAGQATSGACGATGNPSEARQAQFLTDIVGLVRGQPWMGPVFWFAAQDVPVFGSRFGITCHGGAPKPALGVFRQLVP